MAFISLLEIASPKPGWSEQNPQQWWVATAKATKAVLRKAKVKADQEIGRAHV